MVRSPLGLERPTDRATKNPAPFGSGAFEDLAICRLRFGYLARRCPVRTGTVLIWVHIMVATHDIAATAAKPVAKAMLRTSCEAMVRWKLRACSLEVAWAGRLRKALPAKEAFGRGFGLIVRSVGEGAQSLVMSPSPLAGEGGREADG